VHYYSCNYRYSDCFDLIPLLMSSLQSYQTNPNTVTNLSKLFNYIAPASLFYAFLGTGNQKRRIRMAADEAGKYSKANAVPQNIAGNYR